MKKFLLGALLPLLMLGSCSNNEELAPPEGEGTLVITTKILTDGVEVIPTRAETPTLFVTIRNKTNNTVFVEKMVLPDNGIVENIPVGNYDITLTTHPDGFQPIFEVPCYEGTKQNVQIAQNNRQNLAIDCIQKNAGVRFIYDSSLHVAGLGDIYPIVIQNDDVLEYEGGRKQQTGYFNAGDVTVTLTDTNGTPYTIGGEQGKNLTLRSEQLWEVTLKTETTNNPGVVGVGSITMTATIIPVNTPTHREDYLVENEPVLNNEVIYGSKTLSIAGATYTSVENINNALDIHFYDNGFSYANGKWGGKGYMLNMQIVFPSAGIVEGTYTCNSNQTSGTFSSFEVGYFEEGIYSDRTPFSSGTVVIKKVGTMYEFVISGKNINDVEIRGHFNGTLSEE